MRFEWDENKRLENLKKHGFDFHDAQLVLQTESITLIDDRFDYGETRFVSFGMLYELVVAVVYVEDGEIIRIISLRKATKNEENEYYRQIRD